MKIAKIICYLVRARKGEDEQEASPGTEVLLSGQPYTMLREIFDNAESECRTDIAFLPADDGSQQNDFRDILMSYAKSPSEKKARLIAARLERVTTQRSGLGLLFLVVATESGTSRVMLSRFPANQGILAEEKKGGLSVAFLEKVFMKTATAYKAVLYEDKLDEAGFWSGLAVDRQINGPDQHLANYWIRDFLASELKTTPAAGTRRLALALRDAIGSTKDEAARAEIGAAATLAAGLNGKTTSIAKFMSDFSLSSPARFAIERVVRDGQLMSERFKFDSKEFERHIMYRSVVLDSGAVLTAEASRFDEVFEVESLPGAAERTRFTAVGRRVDERLKRRLT